MSEDPVVQQAVRGPRFEALGLGAAAVIGATALFVAATAITGVGGWQLVVVVVFAWAALTFQRRLSDELDARQCRRRHLRLAFETAERQILELGQPEASARLHECPDGPQWSFMAGPGWVRSDPMSCELAHGDAP